MAPDPKVYIIVSNLSTYYKRAKKVMQQSIFPKQCMLCGTYFDIHVHHIDEDISNNNEFNLIYLCKEHHETIHGRSIF